MRKSFNPGWLNSQNPKRHQHRMNQLIRLINDNVENDPMWKGRYYVRQIQSSWSGFYGDNDPRRTLYTRLELVDRKTNKREETGWETVNSWCFNSGYKVWRLINDFIINSGVWEEEPRIMYENTPDYRGMERK